MLRLCPEIVLDKYVAVTSNDSGIANLTGDHLSSGWEIRSNIGYSPRIDSFEEIPCQLDGPGVPGYDEYYIFDGPFDLGELTRENIFAPESSIHGKIIPIVNVLSFELHSKDDAAQTISDLFWRQLLRLSPATYLADGRDYLTFVTRNPELFQSVDRRLTAET